MHRRLITRIIDARELCGARVTMGIRKVVGVSLKYKYTIFGFRLGACIVWRVQAMFMCYVTLFYSSMLGIEMAVYVANPQ